MAKKPKLLADGKDFVQGQGFIDASLEINLPGKPTTIGPVRGVGTLISKSALQEMQNRYFTNKQPNDTQYVIFGREALLTILAQYDCAGIKFYFVERMNTNTKQLTLGMVGVDEAGHDLSTSSTTAGGATTQDSLITDVGSDYPPTV